MGNPRALLHACGGCSLAPPLSSTTSASMMDWRTPLPITSHAMPRELYCRLEWWYGICLRSGGFTSWPCHLTPPMMALFFIIADWVSLDLQPTQLVSYAGFCITKCSFSSQGYKLGFKPISELLNLWAWNRFRSHKEKWLWKLQRSSMHFPRNRNGSILTWSQWSSFIIHDTNLSDQTHRYIMS